MSLRFFNTLTRAVEEFVPREPGKVAMYTCGPTVYNRAHIGNFRTFLFSDVVRRYLRYIGYDVLYVMNLTDVDDRTITGSQKEGLPMREFTERYTRLFFEDRDHLGIEPADVYPKATGHIPEMVRIVKSLAEKGHAYQSEGSWYFRVESFPDYGKLARLDQSGMRQTDRVADDDYTKRDPRDFALWKAWEPSDGDVFWETEIGKGRPGWHLECSAMSLKYLGEAFDLHLGGVDLIFPHHQNEVAQTEACTGHPLARYWLHSEFLMIDSEKMSKSLGNVYSIGDLVDKGYKPREIRLALLSAHYRQQQNFTYEGLESARAAVERIDCCLQNLKHAQGGGGTDEVSRVLAEHEQAFRDAMDDDLNFPNALAAIFGFIRELNILCTQGKVGQEEVSKILFTLRNIDSVVGFLGVDQTEDSDSEIDALICAREEARKSKNWAEADRIRNLLNEKNITIEDRAGGTSWRRKP